MFRRCIRKEDADNPERWMARQSETGPCKLTPGEKTERSMKWEVSCPKTNMRGNGIARLTGPGTVESAPPEPPQATSAPIFETPHGTLSSNAVITGSTRTSKNRGNASSALTAEAGR